MNKEFSLEDRMKDYYEHSYRIKLPRRLPVIMRLDGKAFHTFTKNFKRPFDISLMDMMNKTAIHLCSQIQGSQIAYVQSDEISILIHNYKKINSESWFDNNIQKMTSISAGMASSYFTNLYSESSQCYRDDHRKKLVIFDSRVFVLPETEVNNYFVWRQQDATRNSIEMVAQSMYSSKELHKKNCNMLQEMIFQKSGENWNNYPTSQKRGRCVIKQERLGLSDKIKNNWIIDDEIPVFSQDKDYIEKYLKVED